ncbi:hypothetical protein E4U42_003469 [Claviceps africana]|uniref:Sfi1 spindle body domain-containing protein n=1 Tax=Claviceps africana TaxID=83212 RepID=A0A8K0NHS8_9HYPO|nr:hypothetical protein E4U42_003469 [Claviceps africana]
MTKNPDLKSKLRCEIKINSQVSKMARLAILHISILHYIVSTAQDQFDKSPHPKPLPAAVLFKAYDDVLPTFGIDPDSDHHLSALIFRIGGESGTASLLEKFHALLKRMNILLEFDDDATISDSSSPIASTSCRQAVEVSPLQIYGSPATDKVQNDTRPRGKSLTVPALDIDCAQSCRIETISSEQNRCGFERILSDYHFPQESRPQAKNVLREAPSSRFDRKLEDTFESLENPVVKSIDRSLAFQKLAIISAIDQWRKVATGGIMTRPRDHIFMVADDDRGQQIPMNYANIAKDQILLNTSRLQNETLYEAPTYDLSTAENHALSLRAARARQIFLASRILSRWADKTAIRVDREAVARRHMVRFRCFNNWLQAPNSTRPRIRHLKAIHIANQRDNLPNAEYLVQQRFVSVLHKQVNTGGTDSDNRSMA